MEQKFVFVTEEGNNIEFDVLCQEMIGGNRYVVLSNDKNDYVAINKIVNDELVEIDDINELADVVAQIKLNHPELELELQ